MQESAASKIEYPPIAVSVPQAGQMIGRGAAAIYELIGAKKIRAVKSDGRTLVVVASLHEYINNLNNAVVAPPRRRKPQHLREAVATAR
jgi:hypothetical protein